MSLTPTQKLKVRKAISAYCLKAEQNQLLFHYSQARPFRYKEPDVVQFLDCSGYVAVAYWHAMHDTGIYLADPLGMKMTGWGWTGSEIAWLRTHGKPAPAGKWLVGDLVLYGHSASQTVHTAICRTAGDDRTSWWSSNGNEHAPERVRIGYHPDPIVGVYRHPALL
jgi:hypothetical protein